MAGDRCEGCGLGFGSALGERYASGDSMTQLAVVETRSLERFAQIANAEHEQTAKAAFSAIDHAIAAGEALLEAQAMVREQGGDWRAWVASSLDFGTEQAGRYCRVAFFQEEVRASGVIGVKGAIRALRQLEMPNRQHEEQYQPHQKIDETICSKIRALAKTGRSQREIGEQFGVSQATVSKWLHPNRKREYERAYRRRLAAQRAALKKQERDRLAKRAGGDISEAYSLIRRAAESLDSAGRLEQDEDARKSLAKAIRLLYRVEDEVAAALKTSNTDAEHRIHGAERTP